MGAEQIYLGSLHVNDFNKFGRTWQVVVQARGEYRTDPDAVGSWACGSELIPLGPGTLPV